MRRLTIFLFSALCLSLFGLDAQVWTDAAALPLGGKATQDTYSRYTRLPSSLKGVVRDPVWNLGINSAGLYVRFMTDSPSIWLKWKSSGRNSMYHMADVGTRGLDLYCMLDGRWSFVGSARFSRDNHTCSSKVVEGASASMKEYMVYLSLYDGVDSLAVGVDEGCKVYQPQLESPSTRRPVVMYGTSILQGGCASRPGMAFTNILSRKLDRACINLGFSGNARLDYEIAEVMSGVEDPAAFVLDFTENCSPELITSNTERFFRILRDAHPGVPVIFVENHIYASTAISADSRNLVQAKNKALREQFDALRRSGEKNLYYVRGEDLDDDGLECTVDGVHYTDFGMVVYADRMYPLLKKILKKR